MKKPMLSLHFSFDELTGSDKFPGLVEKNRLEAGAFTGKLSGLCLQLLEPIRAQFGPVVVTSGYRCPALNAAIGGVPTSQHAIAEAADFIVPGRDLDTVFEWIRGSSLEYGQVILEPGWIHISLGVPYRPDAKCQEALIFDGHKYRKA
jgi:zinc D-Ala-D-Ala carboxypeptidase